MVSVWHLFYWWPWVVVVSRWTLPVVGLCCVEGHAGTGEVSTVGHRDLKWCLLCPGGVCWLLTHMLRQCVRIHDRTAQPWFSLQSLPGGFFVLGVLLSFVQSERLNWTWFFMQKYEYCLNSTFFFLAEYEYCLRMLFHAKYECWLNLLFHAKYEYCLNLTCFFMRSMSTVLTCFFMQGVNTVFT